MNIDGIAPGQVALIGAPVYSLAVNESLVKVKNQCNFIGGQWGEFHNSMRFGGQV